MYIYINIKILKSNEKINLKRKLVITNIDSKW